MTLNLWGYADWDARKDGILKLTNQVSADIIALQEVQTNPSFSNTPQSDFIASHTDYSYFIFAPSHKKVAQLSNHGERSQTASHGLAILSKHPIISSESYFLDPQPSHPEPCTVLFCKIQIDDHFIDVCNVHFGNNDVVSDLQIKELIALCEARNIHPIILGDFNSFDLSRYKHTALKDYTISTDITPYISMPRNNGTLDYILAPNGFKIDTVACPKDYVSDHRAVIAELLEIL
jgi:endonuclease/exonuclease/phosphatase family metal-dependent hydrolase